MVRNELKAYVFANGVKVRCRKQSREMIKLGNYPLGTTLESLRAMAVEKTQGYMKSIVNATLYLDPVEIETCDGIEFESWEFCNARNLKTVII